MTTDKKKSTKSKSSAKAKAFAPIEIPGSISIKEPIPIVGEVTQGYSQWQYHVTQLEIDLKPSETGKKLTPQQVTKVSDFLNAYGANGWRVIKITDWEVVTDGAKRQLISLIYAIKPFIV
jgi:hypothetical protein